MIYKNIEFYNIEDLVETEQGYRLSRVPGGVRRKLNGEATIRACNGAGSELRFNMDSEEVKITLCREEYEKGQPFGIAEVYFGSFTAPYLTTPKIIGLEQTELLIKKPTNIEELMKIYTEYRLPFDPNLVRIILPYDWNILFVHIEGNVSPPKKEQVPSVRYLAYGSSITHGGDAVRPTGSYAMRTAQRLGADLIGLGFAGSAHLDEAMANYIAEREDWDFATLELGINVVRKWEAEQFKRKVDYFISTIARQHRDKWIFCIDMFPFDLDYKQDPKAQVFREIVRSKVIELQLPKLVHVSGLDLLKTIDGLTADLVHPSALGQEEIAFHLATYMSSKIEDSDNPTQR